MTAALATSGWLPHPHDARYVYRGVEVRLASEVGLLATMQSLVAHARAGEVPTMEQLHEQLKENKKSRDGRPYVGRAVVDGRLRFTSISQITMFDPAQYGGCPRRWAYAYIFGKKEEKSEAQIRGSEEYAKQLEAYLKTGVDSLGPVLRSAKHLFPKPGPDIDVEARLGDLGAAVNLREAWLRETDPARRAQLAADMKRVAGITANLVPIDGAPDFRHRRGSYIDADGVERAEERGLVVAEIGDLKTTSRINDYVSKRGEGRLYRGHAKTVEEVLAHPQMVCYGAHAAGLHGDLTHVRLSHVYAQTKNGYAAAKRTGLVTVDEVRARWRGVEQVVAEMESAAASGSEPEDFPVNVNACKAYGRPCTHEAYCVRPLRSVASIFGCDQEGEESMGDNGMFGSYTPANGVGAPPVVPTAPPQSQQGYGMFGTPPGAVQDSSAPPVPLPVQKTQAEREREYAEAYQKYAQDVPPAPPLVSYGDCRHCQQPLTNANASRLADGQRVVHVGCAVSKEPFNSIAIRYETGGVNPADGPRPDAVASSAPLPPEAVAAIQNPALRARVEEHAQLAAGRAAEEALKNPQAAKKEGGGKCPAGGRSVALTQVDVANLRKYACPDCGKKVALKEVAADYTTGVVPGHIVPKPDVAAPAQAPVSAVAVAQPLASAIAAPAAPPPVAVAPPLPAPPVAPYVAPGALPGQAPLPFASAPPPIPSVVSPPPVATATSPALAYATADAQAEMVALRSKVGALEGVALEVFGALSQGRSLDASVVARLANALYVVEPRTVQR